MKISLLAESHGVLNIEKILTRVGLAAGVYSESVFILLYPGDADSESTTVIFRDWIMQEAQIG